MRALSVAAGADQHRGRQVAGLEHGPNVPRVPGQAVISRRLTSPSACLKRTYAAMAEARRSRALPPLEAFGCVASGPCRVHRCRHVRPARPQCMGKAAAPLLASRSIPEALSRPEALILIMLMRPYRFDRQAVTLNRGTDGESGRRAEPVSAPGAAVCH
jgi:hypothetical protein